jgi:hypothetical protein
MANLENCQQVAPYTAEEFAGDTVYGASALELQSPPAGALSSGTLPGMYYLVIESESGYHIKAENINIGGTNGQLSQSSGAYQWNSASAITGSVLPSDVFNIRASDSLADNTNCSNKVIIEIVLQPSFEMPASDHFINIDFGGVAQPCVPVVDEIVEQEIKFELFINNQANFPSQSGFSYFIYVAKYYDSEEYASSIYNPNNLNPPCSYDSGSFNFSTGTSNTSIFYGNSQGVPEYDFNQCWNDEDFFNGSPSCLDSFQPTCYGRYETGSQYPGSIGPGPWFVTSNTNNWTTTCGALGVSNVGTGIGVQGSTTHPNYNEFGIASQLSSYAVYVPPISHWLYHLKFSSANVDNYLSQVDYPFLTPGDGILPPYLCWYISVGSNNNFDLAASTQTIDVWKIVSSTFQSQQFESTGVPTSNPNNIDCSMFGTSGVLISEKNSSGDIIQNNSNLDISNIEITPIDSKTIKLKIPFQPGFQAEIWDDQFARNTKIFINLYANEI